MDLSVKFILAGAILFIPTCVRNGLADVINQSELNVVSLLNAILRGDKPDVDELYVNIKNLSNNPSALLVNLTKEEANGVGLSEKLERIVNDRTEFISLPGGFETDGPLLKAFHEALPQIVNIALAELKSRNQA